MNEHLENIFTGFMGFLCLGVIIGALGGGVWLLFNYPIFVAPVVAVGIMYAMGKDMLRSERLEQALNRKLESIKDCDHEHPDGLKPEDGLPSCRKCGDRVDPFKEVRGTIKALRDHP